MRLPQELAAELEQLTSETGRSKSYYARQPILESLEDRADYLRAVAILERQRGQPNLPLEEVKRELGAICIGDAEAVWYTEPSCSRISQRAW